MHCAYSVTAAITVWDTHHMSLHCLQNGKQAHIIMTDCRRRLCCTVNTAHCINAVLQQDPHGIKQESESSAVGSSSFHQKHLIAVKQEPQEDAQVS